MICSFFINRNLFILILMIVFSFSCNNKYHQKVTTEINDANQLEEREIKTGKSYNKITPPSPPPMIEYGDNGIREMPIFPGCEKIEGKSNQQKCTSEKLFEYIYGELKYPAIARKNRIEGTVIVKFFIDEKGNITAPEILQNIGGGCGKEAVRIVNTMNDLPKKWIPGTLDEKTIEIRYNLPIKFELD